MKLLVCGGHAYTDRAFVFRSLDLVFVVRVIEALIHVDAPGAAQLSREWALARNIPCTVVHAAAGHGGETTDQHRIERLFDSHPPTMVVAFPGDADTAEIVAVAKRAQIPVWSPRPRPAERST